jgi:tripartite-type tricarboxylate transporter receptor subunit TctC
MKTSRLFAALALPLALALAPAAIAQAYPDRPVTLIIPPAAGGGTDTLYRALVRAAEPHLGKPIVVVNRPGAGGGLGTGEIARAKPDGYTIGAVLQQVHLGIMSPELGYKHTDFTYLMMVNADAMAVTVRADSRWKTMRDLLDAARAEPAKISVGNCGSGCISDIATGMIEREAKVRFVHVPFNGHSPGRTAILGGHLDVMMLTPSEAVDFVRNGQLRVLAVCDEKRSAILPDVPSIREATGFGVNAVGWRALGGPAGLPADVQAKLVDAFGKALADRDFVAFAEKAGFELRRMDGPALRAFVDQENVEWRQVMGTLGLAK